MHIHTLAQTDEFSGWLCTLKDRVARAHGGDKSTQARDIGMAKKLLAASKMSRRPA